MHHSTDFILIIHSLFRWVLLAFLLYAIVRGYRGWLGKKAWTAADKKAGLFTQILADMQLLLGLVMYIFRSPRGLEIFRTQDMSTVMSDGRYFAIEHPLMMILAIVLIHIGKKRSQKFDDAVLQHKNAAVFYTLAMLFILSRVPWDHLLTWY